MATLIDMDRISRRKGEPVWELAKMFPRQGEWTEEEYLELEQSGSRLIELVDGFIEFLPMPDRRHQRIIKYMTRRLDDHAERVGDGEALFAPMPVRMWPRHLREPDIMFFKSKRRFNGLHSPPDGADAVMEVLSPGKKNRKRDLVEKREVYERAKIPEYWIIDPEKETITVLVLKGRRYETHGVFKRGDVATSKILPGFSVDVSAVFDAAADK